MKKFFYILMVLALSVAFAACGSKTPNNAVSNTSNTKITYTAEFPYIPAYSSYIKADSVSQPNNLGVITANYTIKNATNIEVFVNYKNIFKKDGWTLTKEQKPNNFVAKKNTHQVTVTILPSKNDVKMIIVTK